MTSKLHELRQNSKGIFTMPGPSKLVVVVVQSEGTLVETFLPRKCRRKTHYMNFAKEM